MSVTTFAPDPDWPSIVELAIELWGGPNKRLSKPDDIRFGTNGGRSVTPSKNVWHDHETGKGGGYIELHRLVRGELPKRPHVNGKLPASRDIARIYDYHDASGKLVLQVIRTISGKPRFRQRRPDGAGGWIWSVKDIPPADRPLYRLPGLRAPGDAIVWITEGEKDADNLHGEGLTATTNIGGAGNWRAAYAQEFRGKSCVILQDNDGAGMKHCTVVAQSLVGVAASVKVLLLPGLADKGDVSDWLGAGDTREDLERLAHEAPEYSPAPQPKPNSEFECTLAELQQQVFEPIRWVVPDYIPEGLTVFAGKPKIGKSWMMLGVALGVARGTETLGKFLERGDVLYCSLEDGKRRMQSRVAQVLGPANKNWPTNFTFRHCLPPLDADGIGIIEQWLIAHPNRRLVVIDTLARVRGMKSVREEQYQYDYRLLGALHELATRYRVAIVVVHHVRKAEAEEVLDTVSGSTGIAGAADTVVVLGKTPHGVRLYLRGRDAEEQDKTVEFDPETGIWSVTGDYDDAVPGRETSGMRRAVLDLLTMSPIALEPAQIAERLGKKSDQIRFVLHRMLRSDPPQVIRNDAGAYTAAFSRASPQDGATGATGRNGQ
jgi:hypothetical protein